MFLRSTRGDTRNGQWANGPFLAVFARDISYTAELRAYVKNVKLTQLGHWMMGEMNIRTSTGPQRVGLSGTYGADGLTNDAKDDALWAATWTMPEDLAYMFWTDDGHNSAGRNGKYIHKWACKHEKALRQPKPEGLVTCVYRLKPDLAEGVLTGWLVMGRRHDEPNAAWQIIASFKPNDWAAAAERLHERRANEEPTEALARFKAERKEKARAAR
jgi:hypothetical protein